MTIVLSSSLRKLFGKTLEASDSTCLPGSMFGASFAALREKASQAGLTLNVQYTVTT